MAYQPTIPTGFVPLNQDYLNLQENFSQINTQFNVDHVPLTSTSGNPPNGYHTVIHNATQTNVTTQPGINQLFAGVPGTLIVNGITTPATPPNGDTQLYSLTGNGGLSQLTGNNASASGYQVFGGVILQWALITMGPLTGGKKFGPVNFPIAFPNACFSITTSLIAKDNTVTSSDNTLAVYAVENTGFSWIFNYSSTTSYTQFYYMAIGN
jgi:hypothetical protein